MKHTCNWTNKHSISIFGIVCHESLFNWILLHVCCFWACWIFNETGKQMTHTNWSLHWCCRCYFIFTSFHFMSNLLLTKLNAHELISDPCWFKCISIKYYFERKKNHTHTQNSATLCNCVMCKRERNIIFRICPHRSDFSWVLLRCIAAKMISFM